MEGAMEDLQDMFIVHTVEEVQVGTSIAMLLSFHSVIELMLKSSSD